MSLASQLSFLESTTSTVRQINNNIVIAGGGLAASTTTGALQIANGGLGVGGGAVFGGTVTATNFIGAFAGTITGTATTATNLAGGTPFQIPYQTAPGLTAFASSGTTGQFWQATTNGAPTWTSTANIYVSRASLADNDSGGVAGQIRYQTGVSASGFINTATTGNFLQANFNGAPTWTSTASIYVQDSVVSTNIRAGTPFQIPYQGAANTTLFANSGTTGQFWQAATNGAPTWTSTANIYVQDSVVSTNIRGGVAGNIPIQTAAGTTGFISTSVAGYVLTMGTNSASWQALSGLASGSATTATNLAGGTPFQIPYQTAPGLTAFASSGTTGQFWQAATNGAPTWTTTANIYVANAVVSTNVRAGTAGQLHYQSAADTTAFVSTATTGNFLQANFVGAPTWTTTANIYVANAVVATNVRGGTAGQLHYQSAADTTAFAGPGTFGQFLMSTGANAPVYQSTLTQAGGNIIITSNTAATSTTTGALQVVNGGMGIGGNLYVGGEIVAQRLTIQFTTVTTTLVQTDDVIQTLNTTNATSTITGALQVAGGAGIGRDLYVGGNITVLGTINASITGISTTATNLLGGTPFQIPYQTAPGLTAFASSGTTGQFWQATTNGAPVWTTTANIYVANAVTATHQRGGTAGQLHYQSAADTTAFVSTATTGNFLQANFVGAPTWTTTANIYVANAVASTNLRAGTAMSIPYQSAADTTAFLAAGTAGQVLSTNGTGSAPTWISVGSVTAGTSTQIQTVAQPANAIYYPTFVDSNNATATAENVFTTSSFVINPSTGRVGLGTVTPLANFQVGNSSALTNYQGSAVGIMLPTGSGSWLELAENTVNGTTFRISKDSNTGVVINTNVKDLGFKADSYGTAIVDCQIVLKTGGNVGVNTASPVNKFHVVGVFGAPATTGSAQNGIARFAQSLGPGSLDIGFGDPYSWLQSRSSSNYATNYALSLNPNGGNVAVGTTSTTNKFEVAGTAGQLFSVSDTFTGTIFAASDISGIPSIEVLDTGLVKLAQYNGTVAIGTGTAVSGSGLAVWTSTYILSLGVGTSGSGTIGEIRATNEVTAYYSDRRLKENVQVIDNALVKVLSLSGITYTPNAIAESYGYDRTKKLVGVFADEIEAVLPEAVRPAPFDVDDSGNSKSGENYKTVQYEKIVPLLIEAIKEQQKSIENLQKEIAQLKSQI